jgi:hypothetical protein
MIRMALSSMPLHFLGRLLLLIFLSRLVLAELPGATAGFVFIDQGATGQGLSDPASRQPVDGNSGTTLGQQRRLVLERAGEIWGQFLVSDVPIEVSVQFSPLGGSALAAAGPNSLERDFPNSRESNTYYPVALANSLAGADLQPSSPDINVTINSDANFYLGFGQNVPGGSFSLLDVTLHELGHGLGFISLVNTSTGALFNNRADVFTRRIFDLEQNLGWLQMNSSQRLTSRTNNPFVVWTGASTTRGLPFVLNPGGLGAAQVVVTDPPAAAGFLSMRPAAFGPDFPSTPLEASLVLARDGNETPGTAAIACSDLTNAEELAGQIVLIRRGGCFFDQKIFRAQQAGAVAVIIANNDGDGLVSMGSSGEVEGPITIPAVFIGQSDGDALEAASPGLTIRFERRPGFIGTNNSQLRLHAPASFSSGSSISHWTTDASPNLLMEPIINRNLDRRLDLTLTQMKDIGWRVVDIPYPHLDYATWASENLSSEVTARAPLDMPGGRGVTNLERYVFGLPQSADRVQLPILSLAEGTIQARYTRSTMPTDVTIGYEISHDLQTFLPARPGIDYLETSVAPLGGSAEEVTLTLLAPSGSRLFLRLRLNL